MKRLAIFLACLFAVLPAAAQKDYGGLVSFDRTVHDFGRIDTRAGAVSCSFEVTNTGTDTLNIFAVVTTCGCTTVEWTRSDIAPGGKGSINVTYKNDEGPYPFDKTLTVYLSCMDKPVILHIKGSAFTSRKK